MSGVLSSKKRTWLITGGAGFFGSHLVEHIFKNTSDNIMIVDNLNYSGTLDRIRDVDIDGTAMYPNERIQVFTWDFTVPAEPNLVKELQEVTHVVHSGGETHVDNSIADPVRFVNANVLGTTNVLNLARELKNLEIFHFVDTDEIYGPAPLDTALSLPPGAHDIDQNYEETKVFKGFKETDRMSPKNPYAATKAGASMMVEAFANTYELPCIVTNMMNLFGERQHPEKFMPLCIKKTLEGGTITVHANANLTMAGMRTYIHCRNAADAFLFLHDEKPWLNKNVREVERYNIVGEQEVDNLLLAETIHDYTLKIAKEKGIAAKGAKFEMVDFHSSRPGHDLRYALDGSKMKGIGWTPPKTFHESLKKMIEWYLENNRWLTL